MQAIRWIGEIYSDEGADELFFLDISATEEGKPLIDLSKSSCNY
jgi:imidazole glycerol phosphate synthase subunit HisF